MYKVHELMNDSVSSCLLVKCKGATILGSFVLMGGRSIYCSCKYGLGRQGSDGGNGGRGMFRGERGAGMEATGCSNLCCCSAMFWVKMDTCCCMVTILFESLVITATACANCSSREAIGEVGEG